jgi:molybdopterin synthase catalytic subunit
VTLNVLFFAQARDRAGRSRLVLDLPAGSRVADAVRTLRESFPALEPLWPHLAIALDGRLAPGDAPLAEGAELALLPPVSGGAS